MHLTNTFSTTFYSLCLFLCILRTHLLGFIILTAAKSKNCEASHDTIVSSFPFLLHPPQSQTSPSALHYNFQEAYSAMSTSPFWNWPIQHLRLSYKPKIASVYTLYLTNFADSRFEFLSVSLFSASAPKKCVNAFCNGYTGYLIYLHKLLELK
jgi:hypothetical protein